MMCGLLKPTSGWVFFDGAEAATVDKLRIGVCPQELVYWKALTCRENLTFMGDMYGIPAPQLQTRVDQLLDLLSLTEKADQAAAKLSGGVKRRLNIALSIVHDPEIVFLDEPSAGLDPQSRLLLWEFIRFLRDRENKTIVLTTHAMEEADALSDRIAIIDYGKLLGLDTPERLKKTLGKGDIVELQLAKPAMNKKMLQVLSMRGILAYELNGKIAVRAPDATSKLPTIIRRIERAGGGVSDIVVRRNSLEDVFVSLTGRTLRD
jgi:ABC-2 type transport system ATP-binding protein